MSDDTSDEKADQKSERPFYYVDLVTDWSDFMDSAKLNRQFAEAVGIAQPDSEDK